MQQYNNYDDSEGSDAEQKLLENLGQEMGLLQPQTAQPTAEEETKATEDASKTVEDGKAVEDGKSVEDNKVSGELTNAELDSMLDSLL